MIGVKGDTVAFERPDGTLRRLPVRHGIVHDPDGDKLRPCHVYFAPYKRTREKKEMSSGLRRYFGPEYEGKKVLITGPEGEWKKTDDVVQIFYVRFGDIQPGPYFHPFYKRAIFKKEPLGLYKAGRVFLLALPGDCVVNHRGFVYP